MAATIYSEKIYQSIMSQKKAIVLKKQQREQNNPVAYDNHRIYILELLLDEDYSPKL